MKLISLAILGSALLIGGCASNPNGAKSEAFASNDSYVPLGTSIPKKGGRSAEDKTLDLQQLENNRNMSNGTNNGAGR